MQRIIDARLRPALLVSASVCLIAALATAAAGQSSQIYHGGKIAVTLLPEPTTDSYEGSTHGYQVLRIRIVNDDSQPHRIDLEAEERHRPFGFNLQRVSRNVEVGPGASAMVSLPIPATHSGTPSGIDVSIDRTRQKYGIAVRSGGHTLREHYHSSFPYAVLTSRGVSADLRDAISMGAMVSGSGTTMASPPGFSSGYPGRGAIAEPALFKSEEPVSGWADQWLAYSRFDGVVATRAELDDSASPEVVDALMRYVECGGVLVVCGRDWTPPAPWDALRVPRALGAAGELYAVGPGRIAVIEENGPVPPEVRDLWVASAESWQTIEEGDANQAMPVVDEVSIPVQGLLILMILFAVAIGPVNILILRQMKRRIWLLWTVPTVSLVTTAVVFLWATFLEGYTPHRRTETLTILDQRTHHATTFGWTAFYAPLTPRGGLHFSSETEVTAALESNDIYRMSGHAVSLDWTNDQHLAGGWVRPRVPAHFRIRKSDTRRERITIDWEAEPPTAVNGLGVALASLDVADEEGRIYHADHIAAGRQVALAESGQSVTAVDCDIEGLLGTRDYGVPWTGMIDRAVRDPGSVLGRRTYLAVTESTGPFIRPGIERTRERECRAVVLGILEK